MKISVQAILEPKAPSMGGFAHWGKSPTLLNQPVQPLNYNFHRAGGYSKTLLNLFYHKAHTRHQKKLEGVIDNYKNILISVFQEQTRQTQRGEGSTRRRRACPPQLPAPAPRGWWQRPTGCGHLAPGSLQWDQRSLQLLPNWDLRWQVAGSIPIPIPMPGGMQHPVPTGHPSVGHSWANPMGACRGMWGRFCCIYS